MTLEEYAKLHPTPDAPPDAEAARIAKTMQERADDIAEAKQLKQSILTQLEAGNDAQMILYTAIKCIGLYTNDDEYITTGQSYLDKVYADLAQQSFIQNNAEIAAQRLEEMQDAYKDKLRKGINRQLNGYRRIEKALNEALTALDDMDDKPVLTE